MREAIKNNLLGQLSENQRAFNYPRWLELLSFIIQMKMYAHHDPDAIQSSSLAYKTARENDIDMSRLRKTQVLSDEDVGLPQGSTGESSTKKPSSDFETLIVQAVDCASFLPGYDEELDPSWQLIENRRLCVTHAGRLGLVPSTACEGDEILVFGGAITPFVVRKNEDGSHRLVGDCYVRGLMHGEAMQENDMQKIVLT